jgi:hypothetical protein
VSVDDLISQVWEEINIYEGPEVFLQSIQRVDLRAGLIYSAVFAQSEICNGGFKQFFSNSTGVLAPEAIQGFELIGMPETAQLIRRGGSLLGEAYPREGALRQSLLSLVNREELDRLDRRFFESIDNENGGFVSASEAFANTLS